MPDSPRADIVNRAADLAHDVAPDLDAILITHYADADTLDTLRPGETDLATAAAVNRAVATEMARAGVTVLAQQADRAAFRRWMAGRDDTAVNRHAWIDRDHLLRGPAAMRLLGLPATTEEPAPAFGKAPGPIADQLLDLFDEEDSGEFDALVQALMAAGRTDVLDLAVRKLGERRGDEAGDELNWVLLVAAEGAALGPSGWAELVTLPVALSAGDLPDGEALGQGLLATGALGDAEEVRLLPGWRSPDAFAQLSFGAVRRVLLDLVAGRPPQDLPPGDMDELVRRGFGVLLGLRSDWALPVWDAIAAADGLPDEPEAETPAEAAQAEAFDRWRTAVFQDSQGCVPLALVAPVADRERDRGLPGRSQRRDQRAGGHPGVRGRRAPPGRQRRCGLPAAGGRRRAGTWPVCRRWQLPGQPDHPGRPAAGRGGGHAADHRRLRPRRAAV